MSSVLVAPSILSADFARLADDVKRVEDAGADWLHIDVMDGHFVPNLTLGPVVVSSLRKHTRLLFDVHLMITDPLQYAEPFVKAGSDSLTFHYESVPYPEVMIREIRALGAKVGMSIKPKTPAELAMPYLRNLDLLLVMTVEPGFGGQAFMADMMPKVRQLKTYIRDQNIDCRIEVDGGINPETGRQAVEAGADVLVAGSAIFRAPDPAAAVRALKSVGA